MPEGTPGKQKSIKISKSPSSKEEMDNADTIKIGILLFTCALGGTEILDENVEELYKNTSCCLIHCTQKKGCSLSIAKYFSVKKFSAEFLDLLCKLTKKSSAERIRFSDIMSHEWFTEQKGVVDNSLMELLQISCLFKKSQLPKELQGPSEKQFERILDALKNVIPFCVDAENIIKALTAEDKKQSNDLANDLGLEQEYIWNKLNEVFYDITNSLSN